MVPGVYTVTLENPHLSCNHTSKAVITIYRGSRARIARTKLVS